MGNILQQFDGFTVFNSPQSLTQGGILNAVNLACHIAGSSLDKYHAGCVNRAVSFSRFGINLTIGVISLKPALSIPALRRSVLNNTINSNIICFCLDFAINNNCAANWPCKLHQAIIGNFSSRGAAGIGDDIAPHGYSAVLDTGRYAGGSSHCIPIHSNVAV